METSRATALPKFVEQVSQGYGGSDRRLTVNELRLSIRDMRMTELSDWSNRDLDMIEAHAAQFEDTAPLECVLDRPSEGGGGAAHALPVASLCSPSPFAWT